MYMVIWHIYCNFIGEDIGYDIRIKEKGPLFGNWIFAIFYRGMDSILLHQAFGSR